MIEKIAHLAPEMEPKFIKIELENSGNPHNYQKMSFFEKMSTHPKANDNEKEGR